MALQLKAFDPYDLPDDPQRAVVVEPAQFERLMSFLRTRPWVIIDYETSGLAWYRDARSCGIALGAWDDQGRLWSSYVPYRHQTGEPQLSFEQVGPAIGELLADERVGKVAHNIKFEDHFSRVEGWQLRGPRYDTMVAARLWDENRSAKLKERAASDLGWGEEAHRGERVMGQCVQEQARGRRMGISEYLGRYGYSEVRTGVCGYYACGDILQTGGLHSLYESHGLSGYYSRIWPTEMGLTRILCDMEVHGMLVDVKYLEGLQVELHVGLDDVRTKLRNALGASMFNPASDAEVLFYCTNVLGLPLTRRTKKGQLAVDRESLEPFVSQSPVIRWILDWRDLDKLLGTYVLGIIDRADADHYVHGDLQSVGTNTGRLSCRSPNLQNFPSDDDERAQERTGKPLKEGGVDPWSIRRAFPVPAGMTRLFADYSQVELRVLAKYSMDPIMVDAYLKDEDIHDRTALEVGKLLGQKVPRRVAKVVNFGLCLLGSQNVLTNEGLVRLDEVKDRHLLWDGIEWVRHDGLVCRGEQEVIEYDDITATPDHIVYTEDGGAIRLGCLASEVRPRRIAIGAIGTAPRRYIARADGESGHAWEVPRCGSCVWCLREAALDSRICGSGEAEQLHLPAGQVQRSAGAYFGRAVRFYGAAVQTGYARCVKELQRAWHRSAIYLARAFHSLGFSDLSRIWVQGFGFRSSGQRWPLRTGEYEVGVPVIQFAQSAQTRGGLLLARASAGGSKSVSTSTGSTSVPGVHAGLPSSVSGSTSRRAKVYDLLNAGPRHRFTVAGKIVSNSYGLSASGLSRQAKISYEDAEKFLDMFFKRYHGIVDFRTKLCAQARREHGRVINLFGRRRVVPNLLSADSYERGRGERQLIGSLIQGTAAELTKESLVRIDAQCRAHGWPVKLVSTIHDEILMDLPTELLPEVTRVVKQEMERYPEFEPIPIKVECAVSTETWADKQEYKVAG